MKINTKYRLYTIAGEKVLVVPGKPDELVTRVIALNSTSEWLWNQLVEKDFSIEEVATLLAGHFSLELRKAEKDAENWIKQLKENLILTEE